MKKRIHHHHHMSLNISCSREMKGGGEIIVCLRVVFSFFNIIRDYITSVVNIFLNEPYNINIFYKYF